ncbi:tetratricopeptide repeat protein [Hephaestia sp. GCM10023244]|uniref:SPOR domain-containing protein n=1 Tax=unclassified Hephaestia TaxID=2631281 RepID=UPI0020775BC9|nr:SPOR domain-containing protein [Hephaestia sp. MAHUQ-44]MCM8730030.1 tetratricopeptide repeat protein [Hephaestia sp. MAHUQ-44]
MTTKILLTIGASALLFGGTMVSCAGYQAGVASASTRDADADARQIAKLVDKASRALARNKAADAVDYAEKAVALAPRDVSYRVLLGQSYLADGRFTSARQAFTDALTLDSNDGKAALSLALAQTAEGDWSGARATLDDHAGVIPAADRGLALALAGDPRAALEVLVPAARQRDATPKTRQNLALAFALAGNWQAARSIAMVDLSPAEVDSRIEQWAAFATPHRASDQVAALLGVKPRADQGQPVALALNADVAPVAMAVAAPVAAIAAGDSTVPGPALAPAATVAMAAPSVSSYVAPRASVVFGPRTEIVQALPARVARPAVTKPAVGAAPRVAAPLTLAAGNWFVQLGAYENAAVARDGWNRIRRVLPAFQGQTPQGMHFSGNGGEFYRLSVGGFARVDADNLCRRYKAKGGQCFVRQDAGDQTAKWVNSNTRLAAR